MVIMDFAMPKLNGIEATRHIKAVAPNIAILVLTAYDSEQYMFAFLAAGAAGYMLKDVSVDQLVERHSRRACWRIDATSRHHAQGHQSLCQTEEKGTTPTGSDQITERELEVLKLAARACQTVTSHGSSTSVCAPYRHTSATCSTR